MSHEDCKLHATGYPNLKGKNNCLMLTNLFEVEILSRYQWTEDKRHLSDKLQKWPWTENSYPLRYPRSFKGQSETQGICHSCPGMKRHIWELVRNKPAQNGFKETEQANELTKQTPQTFHVFWSPTWGELKDKCTNILTTRHKRKQSWIGGSLNAVKGLTENKRYG